MNNNSIVNHKINELLINHSSVVQLSNLHPSIAKGDSGATQHYLSTKDSVHLSSIQPAAGTPVLLPNNTTVPITKTGFLPLSKNLSSSAQKANIVPQLHTSLISLGQLANDNCTIVLTKDNLNVFKNYRCILQGHRNHSDGLWDIPLHKHVPQQHKLNVIIPKNQSLTNLLQYLHASLFSPAKSTLLQAIQNGNLTTFPGLTYKNVTKHLPHMPATALGHMDQHQQGLQSTRTSQQISTDDFNPPAITSPTNQTIAQVISFQTNNKGFFDLTGPFPYVSSRGSKYVLVLYSYDTNAILVHALKSKQGHEIKKAWNILHNKLEVKGLAPSTYIMDNEASKDLKNAIIKNKLTYQLTPPNIHRINAAERAIRTFKNHFISGLATIDPTFPIREWDRLLPQAELSLNLLRNSRILPHLSAYAVINGPFDFTRTPLAPPGTKVVVHEKATTRASWAYHGTLGFYVSPAMEHYRCMTCYIPTTRKERIADTIQFFPSKLNFPTLTLNDQLMFALEKITTILGSKDFHKTTKKLHIDDTTISALQYLTSLLNRMIHPTAPLINTKSSTSATSMASSPLSLQPSMAPIGTGKLCTVQSIPAPNVAPSPSLQKKHQHKTATPQPVTDHLHSTPVPSSYNNTEKQQSTTIPVKDNHTAQLPRVQLQQKLRNICHHHTNNRLSKKMKIALVKKLMHIYDQKTGKKLTLRALLQNPATRDTWSKSASNEYGRLLNGNATGVKGTNTMEIISPQKVPSTKQVTYASMVCDYRPLKEEKYRCRLVVGGDKLPYTDDAAAPAANLLETKLLINSTISQPSARFMSIDISNFFLSSTMPQPEFMKIHRDDIPTDILTKYNATSMMDKTNYIYFQINKGMYGLKQAAILAYKQLKQNLAQHGYHPIPHSVGMWKHKTRKTLFCLCVDDFGIQYHTQADADHLIHALQQYYKITIDWDGRNYCGLQLNWNYTDRYVDISMPGYIDTLLDRLKHNRPNRPVDAPHKWRKPTYGKSTQYNIPIDSSPRLTAAAALLLQSIVGSLLYYSRAVDPSMLPGLNEISIHQSAPTVNTQAKVNDLLDYVATHSNAVIRFHASDMCLHVDSDAAYLVLPRAKSRLAGHFYLSSDPRLTTTIRPNGPVLTECKTIRAVVASAAEAETHGIFHNAQTALPIRFLLQQMGHVQPPTPLKTDNKIAEAFVQQEMRHKKSKSWDMRLWWLKDRVVANHFKIFWDAGENNYADYFTKHFSPKYHRILRQRYLQRTNVVITGILQKHFTCPQLRGCVAV